MSEPERSEETLGVGYGRPPQATRFRKGQSGNPKGRPRAHHRQIPYDSVLGQMVTVREDGKERRITAAEAFILQLTQKGLAGDSAAARASLTAIEDARAKRGQPQNAQRLRIVIQTFGLGSIIGALGIAVKKNRFSKDRVRWELQPWIIEAALGRLGTKQLSLSEQREVWSNARTPEKVRWPEWWSFRG